MKEENRSEQVHEELAKLRKELAALRQEVTELREYVSEVPAMECGITTFEECRGEQE